MDKQTEIRYYDLAGNEMVFCLHKHVDSITGRETDFWKNQEDYENSKRRVAPIIRKVNISIPKYTKLKDLPKGEQNQ